MRQFVIFLGLALLCICEANDRVKLQDVTAITLYSGKMTRGRRVDPVPQIKCVSWCPIPEPRTASCVNRGFDGYDVQWECKADLENGFEFDSVDVLCEGYDYSNDPYILRGSCGLEYTLRASSGSQKSSQYAYRDVQEKSSGLKSVIPFIAGLLLIWALYKTCIAPALNDERTDRSSTNDDYPDDGSGGPRTGWNVPGFGGGGGGGGGYGSRPSGGSYSDASCGGSARRGWGSGGGGGNTGFWTGLATGGMMGYMFGNRNSGPTYAQPAYQSSGGFFGSGPSSSFGGSSFSSGAAHSSTGFGGTRRR